MKANQSETFNDYTHTAESHGALAVLQPKLNEAYNNSNLPNIIN